MVTVLGYAQRHVRGLVKEVAKSFARALVLVIVAATVLVAVVAIVKEFV